MREAPKKYQQNIVKLSYKMSGKMTNVLSLSTNVKRNSRCMHRHACPETICASCFAVKTVNSYDALHKNLNYNTDVLTTRELTLTELDLIAQEIVIACVKNNTNKFRFESFGDLNNDTQAVNYLRLVIAIKFQSLLWDYPIMCALWTKNPDYLIKGFNKLSTEGKKIISENLNVLISSTFVGFPVGNGFIKKIETALNMPVGVFTVERTENEKTNCGARSCDKCGRCYEKFTKTTHVFEVLK